VQVPPPVEVMRTVAAVTDPLLAAGPNAVTQSPTARSVAAADCVELTGVELVVVIFRVSVLGNVGFLEFFVLFEFFELELVGLKLPPEMSMPDTVSVDPVTPVTLPEAMASEANRLAKFEPPGKDGRLPLLPPLRWNPPPPAPGPPRKRKPPADAPPFAEVRPAVHEPVELGVVIVMLRAAMVVFDDFDAVPVAVTQSPAAMELTDSVTVFENAVDAVQLTVVCPLVWLCTSMLDALSAATLPEAAMGGDVAAPAAEAKAVASTTAVAPTLMTRTRPREVRRLLSVSIPVFLFPCLGAPTAAPGSVEMCGRYSFRNASIGAIAAARLAG
jgi:hypothetical protein